NPHTGFLNTSPNISIPACTFQGGVLLKLASVVPGNRLRVLKISPVSILLFQGPVVVVSTLGKMIVPPPGMATLSLRSTTDVMTYGSSETSCSLIHLRPRTAILIGRAISASLV